MKRIFFSAWLGVVGLPLAASATDLFYINSGTVTSPPQIDAINFVNNAGGVFSLGVTTGTALEPFDTSNTQNFTNKGTMTAFVGWRFDTAPSGTGVRRMAASFRNHPSGTVTSRDAGVIGTTDPNINIQGASKLIISATNLIDEGLLTVEELGLMSLSGKNVNLNRGRLQVLPLFGQGSPTVNGTNFLPDVGILDNYWGIGTNAGINSANILTVNGGVVTARAPAHRVQNQINGLPITIPGLTVSPAASFVNTNAGQPVLITVTNEDMSTTDLLIVTNYVVQGAFVGASDPSLSVNARFYPSSSSSNLFSSVVVGLSASISNVVTLQSDALSLFLQDQLASETNFNLSLNAQAVPPTFRPGPYTLSRTDQFPDGDPPNSVVSSDLLFNDSFSNSIVTALYAAYSATAQFTAGTPPAVPGADITNTPGRIEINADTLDLTRTRIRSDGLVSIKGNHLFSSSNAVMDVPNLSFNLSATNGNLKLQSLAVPTVRRFGGTIRCWSGLWTNGFQLVLPNWGLVMDTNTTPPGLVPVEMDLTNNISVGFHVLILDATSIITSVPVRTYEFLTHSTNVSLSDNLNVVRRFITDAQRFTIESSGGLTLSDTVQNWTSVNAPNLLYFTNNGTLRVPNEAHFGDDRALPYAAFVNKGFANAAGMAVRSDYFENSGQINTASLLSIQTLSGKMENGSSTSGDLAVRAYDFKFRNYSHQSSGALSFIITNSLSDNGPGAGASFVCEDGFSVTFANATGRPQIDDLLGTTFETDIPLFASIPHTWPGADRGVSASGFANNLALGELVIFTEFESQAFFRGAGVSNGFYVDLLDLTQCPDFQDPEVFTIDPNLVIYFAALRLPAGFVTPPNADGVPQEPEEFMDGFFGGHLRWVGSFAGPNSSQDVLINGQTVRVNSALRNSKIIDSDGDGVPNFYDLDPFNAQPAPFVLSGAVVPANPPPAKLFAVSWTAGSNMIYQVDYSTNPLSGNWKPLLSYTNNTAINKSVTVSDTNVFTGQRFYRVSHP